MSDVYFVSSRADSRESNLEKYSLLLNQLDLGKIIREGDLVAIKTSFGERGNFTYLRPCYIRIITDKVKSLGGKPFLTDSNTLYMGGRENARDHTMIAFENGFGPEATGAPIVIAGGLLGLDYRNIPVEGDYFSDVKIATAALDADVIISVAHFKGHMICGFGGALKNLGMGFASTAGKRMIHSDYKPEIDPDICLGCQTCRDWCPENAIEMVPGYNSHKVGLINRDICIGCCECVVTCPENALAIKPNGNGHNSGFKLVPTSDSIKRHIPENTRKRLRHFREQHETDTKWRARLRSVSDPSTVQKKIVEYAAGSLHGKRSKFAAINILVDVTPDCDCIGWSDNPMVPNIGITASFDPVSVDAASYYLVNQTIGHSMSALSESGMYDEDKFSFVHDGIDPTVQLDHGQKIGLGDRFFEITPMDQESSRITHFGKPSLYRIFSG